MIPKLEFRRSLWMAICLFASKAVVMVRGGNGTVFRQNTANGCAQAVGCTLVTGLGLQFEL